MADAAPARATTWPSSASRCSIDGSRIAPDDGVVAHRGRGGRIRFDRQRRPHLGEVAGRSRRRSVTRSKVTSRPRNGPMGAVPCRRRDRRGDQLVGVRDVGEAARDLVGVRSRSRRRARVETEETLLREPVDGVEDAVAHGVGVEREHGRDPLDDLVGADGTVRRTITHLGPDRRRGRVEPVGPDEDRVDEEQAVADRGLEDRRWCGARGSTGAEVAPRVHARPGRRVAVVVLAVGRGRREVGRDRRVRLPGEEAPLAFDHGPARGRCDGAPGGRSPRARTGGRRTGPGPGSAGGRGSRSWR